MRFYLVDLPVDDRVHDRDLFLAHRESVSSAAVSVLHLFLNLQDVPAHRLDLVPPRTQDVSRNLPRSPTVSVSFLYRYEGPPIVAV